MKLNPMGKKWVAVLCLLMASLMLITACTPTTPPDEPDDPNNTNPPEEENDLYIKLTQKGESLYAATYQTMLDRLMPNGYAATSLSGGAYAGMFVRDSSIQIMQHIAEGDLDAAKRILQYMASYHKTLNRSYALHVLNPLTDDVINTYLQSETQQTSLSQLQSGSGLYKILLPNNQAAQKFKIPFDTIDSIKVSLDIGTKVGQLQLLVGTSQGDDSIATATIDIASLGGKTGKQWVTFTFDEPLSVEAGQTYFFSIGALDVPAGGNVIAYGHANGGTADSNSFNYDQPAYHGWVKEGHTLAYEIFSAAPTYNDSVPQASVTLGGSVVATQQMPAAFNSKNMTSVALYLSAVGTAAEGDTVTVALYKGDVLVDEQTIALSELKDTATSHSFLFALPLKDVEADAPYTVHVSASREGSVKWYGKTGADADRVSKLGGEAQDMLFSYCAGATYVSPFSVRNQVDGHYMWVNAFAMFVLTVKEQGITAYDEFIADAYPIMADYAEYYFTHAVESEEKQYSGGMYISQDTGLLYNPSYEHSRNGRYWRAYDLITNVFASEAMHKMSQVAELLGKSESVTTYKTYADDLAAAIHEHLTTTFNGKTIYAEMINTETVNVEHPVGTIEPGLIKGFSFVTLAPMAAEWYAMDEQIMKDTYEAYMDVGTEEYAGVDMLAVVVELDDADNPVYWGNHVIGKGFAWELYYCWLNGDEIRVEELMDFMYKSSKNLPYFPETWHKDGQTSDSANQEHANWILYTMARITGKYKK